MPGVVVRVRTCFPGYGIFNWSSASSLFVTTYPLLTGKYPHSMAQSPYLHTNLLTFIIPANGTVLSGSAGNPVDLTGQYGWPG